MAVLTIEVVRKNLQGARYPSTGQTLADAAKQNRGRPDVIDALRRLDDIDGVEDAYEQLQGLLGTNDEG